MDSLYSHLQKGGVRATIPYSLWRAIRHNYIYMLYFVVNIKNPFESSLQAEVDSKLVAYLMDSLSKPALCAAGDS